MTYPSYGLWWWALSLESDRSGCLQRLRKTLLSVDVWLQVPLQPQSVLWQPRTLIFQHQPHFLVTAQFCHLVNKKGVLIIWANFSLKLVLSVFHNSKVHGVHHLLWHFNITLLPMGFSSLMECDCGDRYPSTSLKATVAK